MDTFFMFGKYSASAVNEISAQRTKQAVDLIKSFGGEIKDVYALLGVHDLVLIVTLPGIKEAVKASIALSKQTGVAFTTAPALTVDEFDKLIVEA